MNEKNAINFILYVLEGYTKNACVKIVIIIKLRNSRFKNALFCYNKNLYINFRCVKEE
jgi:hypothetical protein